MRRWMLLIAVALAAPAAAQLLPQLPSSLPRVADPLGPVVARVGEVPAQAMGRLDALRLDRIARLVRDHPDAVALDEQGLPARANEVVVGEPTDAVVGGALARGFRLIERDEALGVGFARLRSPAGVSLPAAIRLLRRLGARDVQADQLFAPSGIVPSGGVPTPVAAAGGGAFLGMIDGGGGEGIEQRGFAVGAPRASDHGAAVASLILGRGTVRGAAPGARLAAADVYGADPAGGGATAIARALAWLVGLGAPVVTISLVGPANPLLGRVVAAAQARRVIVVAPVGNDGPGAPFAYPASYPGVIAVTGVDARGRVLIEAGRASHLDYAAPGADMLAANASGAAVAVRGTSFAAPLVAARLALARHGRPREAAIAALDAEARQGGKRYGRGLVCADCRTPPPGRD